MKFSPLSAVRHEASGTRSTAGMTGYGTRTGRLTPRRR